MREGEKERGRMKERGRGTWEKEGKTDRQKDIVGYRITRETDKKREKAVCSIWPWTEAAGSNAKVMLQAPAAEWVMDLSLLNLPQWNIPFLGQPMMKSTYSDWGRMGRNENRDVLEWKWSHSRMEMRLNQLDKAPPLITPAGLQFPHCIRHPVCDVTLWGRSLSRQRHYPQSSGSPLVMWP